MTRTDRTLTILFSLIAAAPIAVLAGLIFGV
jgi:hypothetical protein